jgi:hypothetical protein
MPSRGRVNRRDGPEKQVIVSYPGALERLPQERLRGAAAITADETWGASRRARDDRLGPADRLETARLSPSCSRRCESLYGQAARGVPAMICLVRA